MDEIIEDGTRADCCGIENHQAENDGFALVRVGKVIVCGECLLEAGVIEEPED